MLLPPRDGDLDPNAPFTSPLSRALQALIQPVSFESNILHRSICFKWVYGCYDWHMAQSGGSGNSTRNSNRLYAATSKAVSVRPGPPHQEHHPQRTQTTKEHTTSNAQPGRHPRDHTCKPGCRYIPSRHIPCAPIRRLLARWCLGPITCTCNHGKNIGLSRSL